MSTLARCFEVGHIAEDHAGHGIIVAAEVSDHRIGWRQREAPGLSMGEIEVAAVKEHPGVREAISAEFRLASAQAPAPAIIS